MFGFGKGGLLAGSAAAAENGRTLTQELRARLLQSLSDTP